MKITSTSVYLSQVLHTLKTSVLPAQTSDEVAADLGWIQKIIVDLLKRQGPAYRLLQDVIKNGEALEAEIHSYLGLEMRMSPQVGRKSLNAFDILVDQHFSLSNRLNDLVILLLQKYGQSVPDKAWEYAQRTGQWEVDYFNKVKELKSDPGSIDFVQQKTKPPLSRAYLEKFLTERCGKTKVLSINRFTNGFGKQTYFARVNFEQKETEEEIVIRKNDPTPFLDLDHFNLLQECNLVRYINSAGIPCPRPIHSGETNDEIDGDFWIMNKLPGTLVATFFDTNKPAAEDIIWQDIATVLGKLHKIPLEHFESHIERYYGPELLSMTISDVYRRKLAGIKKHITEARRCTSPTISLLLAWCEQNIPEDLRKPVIVHGDFNIHNMLAEDGKITAVLDWETATFGAPEQDLAYIHSHVAKHTDWKKFLQIYNCASGMCIDESCFSFYRGVQFLVMALGCNNAMCNFTDGHCREIRFVALEMGFGPFIFQASINCCESFKATVTPKEEPDTDLLDAANIEIGTSTVKTGTENDTISTGVNEYIFRKAEIIEQEGKRYTKSSDGRLLEVFGHSHNLRQTPTTHELYQESVVLVWWDRSNKIGGFHRLGHEPNKQGGKVLTWNYIVSPQGIYKKQTHLPLRAQDLTATGGFGSGDGITNVEVIDGGEGINKGDKHVWSIEDAENQLSLRIEHTDTGPNVDCYPKRGTLSSDVAPTHFDIGGIAEGKLTIKSQSYAISALSFRDKGWGPRDWTQILSHRWLAGTSGPEFTFIGLTFHSRSDDITSFGWVVRNGLVTFAKSVDIITYIEHDGASNRGGYARFVLTTGEVIDIKAEPVMYKAGMSFYEGVACVDQLCSFSASPGEFQGMCDFETSNNLQGGMKVPARMSGAVIGDHIDLL